MEHASFCKQAAMWWKMRGVKRKTPVSTAFQRASFLPIRATKPSSSTHTFVASLIWGGAWARRSTHNV
jgi:hypothetical protein